MSNSEAHDAQSDIDKVQAKQKAAVEQQKAPEQ
jgi:hypothetical protein